MSVCPFVRLSVCVPVCLSVRPSVCLSVSRSPLSRGTSCYSNVALPLFENGSILEQPLNLWGLARRYTDTALSIIRRARERGQPYLLYMALAHMHVPLSPSPPPAGGDGAYAASLREMDRLVGALKSATQGTDTLIWFTGDNGPWEQKCQYAGSVGPFQGKWQISRGGGSGKKTTWEGGHRVPTVAYWPGHIPTNSTSPALLSGMDIFPTLLSLAGVSPPTDRRYDGVDATDVLLHGAQTGREFLLHPNSGAAGRYGDLQSIRIGHYKVFYLTGGAEACDGSTGNPERHDPPLIFDLRHNEPEATPLEAGTREYQEVLEHATRKREELLWDIATDQSVSAADYTTDQSAAPCCEPLHPACRCHTRK